MPVAAPAALHAAIAGEALIDLIRRPDGSYLPCLGGALYNLCRALARQGEIGRASWGVIV